jgi:hypothetical protein
MGTSASRKRRRGPAKAMRHSAGRDSHMASSNGQIAAVRIDDCDGCGRSASSDTGEQPTCGPCSTRGPMGGEPDGDVGIARILLRGAAAFLTGITLLAACGQVSEEDIVIRFRRQPRLEIGDPVLVADTTVGTIRSIEAKAGGIEVRAAVRRGTLPSNDILFYVAGGRGHHALAYVELPGTATIPSHRREFVGAASRAELGVLLVERGMRDIWETVRGLMLDEVEGQAGR